MLLYITVMLKPLIPIISDAFSHTFNEMAHIATVHAKYGSNHLATQLADTGRDDNSKNQSLVKSVSEVPLHVPVGKSSFIFRSNKANKNYCLFTLHNISEVYIFSQSPPPKFL